MKNINILKIFSLTIFILVILYFFCLQSGCFTTISEVDKNINYTASITPPNDLIIQWAYNNDGTLDQKLDFMDFNEESWKNDKINSKKGIDINFNHSMNPTPSRSVLVAVIDSDMDINNEIFEDIIWTNNKEIPNDGKDNDHNGFIDDYCGWNFCESNNKIYNNQFHAGIHGTHILGTLGARDTKNNFFGILSNTKAKIMCLKALSGNSGGGKIKDVVEAIDYADKNGAKICCLSLTTSQYNTELFNAMKKSKMLFVVAAGNDGIKLNKKSKLYPVNFELDNMITVTAIRCDGKLSCNSNYGDKIVDLAAPGADIIGPYPEKSYSYLSGSSVAVPFVAGVAGQVYSNSKKELSSLELKKILIMSVKKINVLKGKVKTAGIVNYKKSMKIINAK